MDPKFSQCGPESQVFTCSVFWSTLTESLSLESDCESEVVSIPMETVLAVANFSLNDEAGRTDKLKGIESKFYALLKYDIMAAAFIFSAEVIRGKHDVFSFILVLPYSEMSEYLPRHALCEEKIHKIMEENFLQPLLKTQVTSIETPHLYSLHIYSPRACTHIVIYSPRACTHIVIYSPRACTHIFPQGVYTYCYLFPPGTWKRCPGERANDEAYSRIQCFTGALHAGDVDCQIHRPPRQDPHF